LSAGLALFGAMPTVLTDGEPGLICVLKLLSPPFGPAAPLDPVFALPIP